MDYPIPGGNRERIGKWADFVYLRCGGVTHVRPYTETAPYPVTLCGREISWGESWLGTGSQAEYDRARRMPPGRDDRPDFTPYEPYVDPSRVDSHLGKYASEGAYEADLYRDPAVCRDCGCPS